jgi:arylsulfatase
MAEQRTPGTFDVWRDPLTRLRIAKLFNLRSDPYERADITSNTYNDWAIQHMFLNIPAMAGATKFLETFKEYPPRQRPEGMDFDELIKKMQQSAVGR